ncbi:ABC transporter ATP-binding protein [Desulfogranum mediterraneum]|uniref:ABC transporter ATP-binding protein n=1 Tax=Desulfogranum mediterraneum TaxID=160661 RepID=UPI00040E9AF2|nr:ABC transporter ATP-binding protein [Desulfogranum mediterraneum]
MEAVIRVRGLSKRFGDFTAVDQVDMSIPPHGVYGFLGPNGSGKTTAIRMMCGLLAPTAGEIEVLGMRIPEQTELIRRQVGYMTQKFSMYADLTILQNMEFMARIMGVRRAEQRGRIRELLQRFRLEPFSRRLAGALSGGQKRRLALAAAVIHQPRLLLLDEPTSEVDPNTRREFWDELFLMCESGTTVLVTTHLMDEAERCHHLAIINEGRKVADGSPEALKGQLGAGVFAIDGPQITAIRNHLEGVSQVLATTRIGLSLRVMLMPGVVDGLDWLREHLAGFTAGIEPAGATIEDVFVMATRENGAKGAGGAGR